jgi:penicillin-binding protein 1A
MNSNMVDPFIPQNTDSKAGSPDPLAHAKRHQAATWRSLGFARRCLFLLGLASLGGGLIGTLAYLWFARGLPTQAEILAYETPLSTRILAGNGLPITEFARERRAFVTYEQLPPLLVGAFLSAEDKTFFEHGGIDYPGLIRALLTNFQNLGKGRRQIGASTITQQMAKNLFVGDEYSYDRKIREAIVTWRMEQVLRKEQILELYLNQVFLGQNSYGVGAAALSYFNKSLNELSIAEIAYLAAIPKSPSNYHPTRRKQAAIARRNYVLREMAENGYITQAQAQQAMAADLVITPPVDRKKDYSGDYFLEEVRRDVLAKLGEKALYEGGLTVRSTLDSRLQKIAEDVMRAGLVRYDRARRWRGPAARIDTKRSDWPKQLAALALPVGDPDWRAAVVLARGEGHARIGFSDGSTARLPDWATPWSGSVAQLKGGDVIPVAPAGTPSDEFALRQIPEVSGGLVALDPNTGRVLAMVGGFDSRKSQFNRATQALRQPGSAFKPLVYAAALDNGFTPSSIIVDAEYCVFQSRLLGEKCFKNFSGRTYGPQTLRTGVELSRNLMTVRLADRVGMDKVAELSDRLDITPKMQPVLGMALGAGETTVLRLVNAYGMLVNGGKRIVPTLIDRIQDRRGKTIYSHDQRTCPTCNASDWDGDPMPALPDVRPQVLDALTAYQITHILEGVIQRGTGRVVADLDRPMAGKTGTSNNATNVWFVGMSPDLVVGLYIGFDRPRSLGNVQGGTLAAPIFRAFMKEALKEAPKVPFRLPNGIRLVRVDARSGKLAVGAAGERVIFEAFKPGTEPLRPSQLIGIPQVVTLTDADFAAQTGGIY